MHRFLVVPLLMTLCACGMKGDLYEPPPPPATEQATPTPSPANDEPDGRRTIPAPPDPALAR